MTKPAVQKNGLHPRNRHRDRYDFPTLKQSYPALIPFVTVNAYGDESVDFANPEAVKTLNQALLQHFYQIEHWEIPDGFCAHRFLAVPTTFTIWLICWRKITARWCRERRPCWISAAAPTAFIR